jgi:AcrR family transcriptional regulator
VAGRRDPTVRIFEGLILAMARHGVVRTSMTDVSLLAGISRGTLYRYFSTKEELLAGLSQYLFDDLSEGLRRRVQATPAPDRRIQAMAVELVAFAERRPGLERLAVQEPDFVIGWYRSCATGLIDTLTDCIAPVLDPAEQSPSAPALAELLVHLALTLQLLPPPPGRPAVVELAAMLDRAATGGRTDAGPGSGRQEWPSAAAIGLSSGG